MNLKTNPSAFITTEKQRVKQYLDETVFVNSLQGTIYLENGIEFEIELYNPLQTRVLAEISINGNKIGAGVIIRPGERVFLDRFIDENKKFLFTTYTIEDNEQNKTATRNNGLVEIIFYKEKILPHQSPQVWMGGTLYERNYPIHNTYVPMGTHNNIFGSPTTNFVSPNSLNTTLCSTNDTVSSILRSTTISTGNSITETGRIEKGSKSTQMFHQVEATFDLMSFSSCKWKILPKSKEIITKDDIVLYCPECGSKKKKDSHRFCPHCGTKY